MYGNNVYHMSIDQVKIVVLKYFSEAHITKLLSNLFHKHYDNTED